ncbi:MAG: hypothetical protein FWC15_00230 [Fibromonadales bacterium]|nr:hypothetical protein [Fibromonadales bacterium]
MKKILKIQIILQILVQTSCMQLEYAEMLKVMEDPSSSSVTVAEGPTLQMGEHELAHRGISYYEAILISNKMSLEEGLDTLYQYDAPVFTEDSLFWLPNIRVLEERSGYRLPTKDEWLAAEVEKQDANVGEWLYGEAHSQYAVFELAPNFVKAVGLYRERSGYPVYGMRVVKVFLYINRD